MSNRRGGKSSSSSRRPVASKREPDTVLKGKYGPYPGRPNDRHSGLTPIVPHITRDGVGTVNASTLRREQQQRNAFYNFTAKQLLDLDANITSTRSLKASDLNIPLLPCFVRDRWKTNGEPHALGQLGPGKWFAKNDVVWELLQPTLQLASMLLINIQNDLYDTLLCGTRIPIDPERIPENLPEHATPEFVNALFSTEPRGLTPDDPALQKSKKMLLHALSSFVFFKFIDVSETISFNGCTKCGLQRIPDGPPLLHCHIILNHTNLEPLLRPDITASEKLAYQWRVAVTLTHECFHAMFNISDFIRAKKHKTLSTWNLGSEPYYENHSIQECGFLMEQVALGGVTRGERNPKGSLYPTIALFWTEWPTVYWASYTSNFMLKTPALNPRYNFYPIPVTHFEDVHQMTFWLHTVRAFGTKMLGLRSNKVRMQVTQLPHFPETYVLCADDGEVEHFEWKARHLTLKSKQDMSPDERRACKAGDDLIKRAELNEEFFIESSEQSKQVKAIVDFNKSLKDRLKAITSENYSIPEQEIRQLDPLEIIKTSMQTQYNMLMGATMAHRAAVNTYFQMAISGDAPIEIKDHLLLFNQGFRGFARQIAHEYWTDELSQDYEDIDEKLEFLRQMLYSPADARNEKYAIEYEEFGEIAIIMNAYDQFHTEPEFMKQVISQGVDVLEARWKSSRYCRTCANIIKLATSILTGETADAFDTINKIEAKIQTLIFLLNGEDNKRCESWTSTLDDMIKRMRKIASDLFDKVMATKDIEVDEYDPMDEEDISTDNDMDDTDEANLIPGQPA
ncbi:hypothetical protein BELL_1118g00020 [Botrytis elliptica]|uniref:Uncharacterized protein n=1 Tax=Botrytis elliptica TaxID=278938 RepID=A0A4Z1IL98_9HELO|nr:hypothetical protein BELL_1118g00020 [Botrytis elliptica]